MYLSDELEVVAFGDTPTCVPEIANILPKRLISLVLEPWDSFDSLHDYSLKDHSLLLVVG